MHKVYGEITVNNLITLLFVKTKGEWKMVHEHHSPVSEQGTDPNAGGPYVMWDGLDPPAYNYLIHVMVPITDRDR